MSGPTAIIAEDEPALAYWLTAQLERLWPDLHILGVAADGNEAARLLEEHSPDIAFLDIRLPDKSGLDVALNKPEHCQVVFVTAFNEYAIAAFESEAVDYLLKPVEEERLIQTLSRLKKRLEQSASGRLAPNADLAGLVERLSRQEDEYLEWIQVLVNGEIRFVPVDEVILFAAADKLTVCHDAANRQYWLRTPLKAIETRLDPRRYWRIHRSTIVRVASIDKVVRDTLSGTMVYLKGYEKGLPVSHSYLGHFQRM